MLGVGFTLDIPTIGWVNRNQLATGEVVDVSVSMIVCSLKNFDDCGSLLE